LKTWKGTDAVRRLDDQRLDDQRRQAVRWLAYAGAAIVVIGVIANGPGWIFNSIAHSIQLVVMAARGDREALTFLLLILLPIGVIGIINFCYFLMRRGAV
jgi:hypothetical protein